jgi:phenylalanyl-tRNA synthetase beta chain
MRVPISWLKDYVDIPDDLLVEELAEKMTIAGLEVGKIDYIGLPQSQPKGIVVPPSEHLVWERDKIVLGFIHEVKQHPDADRLVLAMVDHGTGEIEQIVTGAPNLFQYVGQKLDSPIPCPIAREGSVVYDGHSDEPGKLMKLKEKKIRGIPNRHMVCSEMELGISGEHEGVLLLNSDEFGGIAPGTPFADVLGDVVLDVELTPNLARLFNIVGIAREVAALLNLPLKEPDYNLPNADASDAAKLLSIDIQRMDLNPRFTAAILQNVEIKPSPLWMQRRLKLIGQRPINNIVDVTNYVMFEVGQPTHAFDYDILKQRAGSKSPTLITRLPEASEKLTTLDGAEYKLEGHNLIIVDAQGPVSMSGVMGGLETEVQDVSESSKGSQTVLLEAAAWDYVCIRQTLSTTKMHSEASARFSRGVHPEMAIRGLKRAAKLMAEVSGATLVPGIIDEYPNPAQAVVVELPVAEVGRILGFDIPQPEIVDILKRLQFDVSAKGEVLTVTVPDHRLDIGTGVVGQADLIEEIARIYGYNRIPDTQISDALPPQRSNPSLEREENTRDILVQTGLREVINYRLTTPEREALLVPPNAKSAWAGDGYVELANPISADKVVMRHTLLAGLLEIAERNVHFQERQALFEIGNVYLPDKNSILPLEPTHLAILLMGRRHARDWQSAGGDDYLDFYDLKGVLIALLDGLRIEPEGVQIVPGEHSTFHPGRVAKLIVHGDDIGYFGDVHPLVRDAFGLEIPLEVSVVAAELELDRLLAYARPSHDVRPIPTQPAVYQDISLVIDRSVPAAEVEKAIWEAGGNLLVDVSLFDIYTGEQIPAGKKSLAYSLTYQHPEETLTDKKVAKVHGKIEKALAHKLGAALRQ